ncbi:MAG: hypothetical protein P8H56_05920 [Crocinitomicaceae bacterium]|nr:hypothetical protein [Crocinitomicaceae bacterium]|tara:strand:+ start:5066 stop:5383 length:318 start_codon:yes stop_codon:yes gene_type:complete
MFIVNRGYILVRGKQPFVDWANAQQPEFEVTVDGEPTIYLVEEEFYDEQLLIKENFKRIFFAELDAVSDDESSFPDIKLQVFNDWFNVETGSTVMDTMKGGLNRE